MISPRTSTVVAAVIGLCVAAGSFLYGQSDVKAKEVVAIGHDVRISNQAFDKMKAEVDLAFQMQGAQNTLTNDQLLDLMLKDELFVRYGQKRGVKVKEAEVKQAIDQQRKALEAAGPEAAQLKEMLYKSAGLTEATYWTDPKTVNQYAKYLLQQKTIEFLVKKGELKTQEDLNALQEKLLAETKPGLRVKFPDQPKT
ncbi:SurA N-terminal domain-containing protein [Paenibacillus sp. UNC499MF]|uniref:SurA N-terminal domain-containing protein n=1 Tax=unclassified Paenibacillus TaxID=185978 RepID=UPI00089F9292|nr:SurA N-terminal domain-containing protein [Paenibacillus sp. UNC499MF]SEG77136.1 SurA N-terminal domain-containing protein [Paenibacillus sp. UNC499MF]